MPELPEVEVTRRSFAAAIAGARVTGLRMGKPLRWPLGVDEAQLLGTRVGETSRRGKYLWLPLERPEEMASILPPPPEGVSQTGGGLLLHLGMSGSLAFGAGLPPAGPHDHFELHTNRGSLRLNDPRRFGAVLWSPSLAAEPAAKLLAGLGLEPFDPRFDGQHLKAGFARRSAAVKQALLAGDLVVGAGNIYACEALFRAGIDPRTPANKLSGPRCQRLAEAVRGVLGEALAAGGTTLRDFKDAHGVAGSFQMQAQVYGREGEPCRQCGVSAIRRIVQGQRSSFFCATCQKK